MRQSDLWAGSQSSLPSSVPEHVMTQVDSRHWQEHQTPCTKKEPSSPHFPGLPSSVPNCTFLYRPATIRKLQNAFASILARDHSVQEMTKHSSHLFHLNSRQFLFLLPRRHHSETSGLRMPALHTWAGTLLHMEARGVLPTFFVLSSHRRFLLPPNVADIFQYTYLDP